MGKECKTAPVLANVPGIALYGVSGLTAYLQTEFSLVERETVVLEVPDIRRDAGWPLERVGGEVSVPSVPVPPPPVPPPPVGRAVTVIVTWAWLGRAVPLSAITLAV